MRTLLFCLFLVPFTVFGQKMRTDLQEENLKGKVKTTVTTYYKVIYKNGKVVLDNNSKNNSSKEEAFYNKDGNLLTFKEIANIISLEKYLYDEKGRKLKKLKSNNGGELGLASEYSYTQGKYIEKIYMGDLCCIDTYKYNAQGDPIEKKSIGVGECKQDIDYSVSLKYDSSRRLIVANLSGGHRITKCTYNKEGHLEKEILYEDGDLIETTQYQYISFDTHKNWTKRIMYLTDYEGIKKPFRIETRVLTYYE